jgi:hypothetical protein
VWGTGGGLGSWRGLEGARLDGLNWRIVCVEGGDGGGKDRTDGIGGCDRGGDKIGLDWIVVDCDGAKWSAV